MYLHTYYLHVCILMLFEYVGFIPDMFVLHPYPDPQFTHSKSVPQFAGRSKAMRFRSKYSQDSPTIAGIDS